MAPLRMDDLKLIELVKQNKHLYDKNHFAYHDMAKKSLTWKAISVALGSSVEDCRRRFRCLRDRFTKEKRATQRSKEDMLEDPLLPIIYKKMMFLWDHLLHRGSCDGNSGVKTKEVVESPETDDDEDKPMRILNKLAEFGEVEELVTEVEIHEVIIYNEEGNVAEVYHQDDLEEEMDSDVNSSDKSDDAGSSGINPDVEVNSDVNLSSENNESGSAGKNPDAEMDSDANLSNEHSRESNNAGSAEKESHVEHSNENDDDGSTERVVKMNSPVNLSKEHSNENDDGDNGLIGKDVEMDSRVNLSKEHSNENDAADSKEKVPEKTSACQREKSDAPNVPETVIYVIEPGELEESTPSNCEVQITPKEKSIVIEEQSRAFHSYTKATYNSENVPQFKRRRKRTSLLINNRRNNQGPDNSGSGVLSLTPSPSSKPLNPIKLSRTSKATNTAFCTMIKSYLDKITRRDRLSAARLQILKILHDELYSSYK